ncbi:MAG: hypothetical protein MJ103_04410 [Saccharofermentans sp.]|nr:hypothetical protein [Saccharofermentans sp.]
MKDTEHKIYISKEMLRDYAVMDKCWTDITLIPFSKISADDIECSEYYRMDLEDMREVLCKCKDRKVSAVSFFLEWWEPLLVHLYDYLEFSDMFGPDPGNIRNMRLLALPISDEDLLRWIICHIFNKYEQFTLSLLRVDLAEYLDIDQLLMQINWHYEDEDNEELIPGRYINLIKHDYIMELDNDLILKDAPPVTRAIFKEFTDSLADAGDFEALRIKGYASYGGSSIYPCDYEVAARCLERLWKEGSFGYAANTLGYIYYYGRLGKPDYEKAFFYFSVGSTYGITESSYKLADMFMKGLYVKRNLQLATSMIEKLYGEERYRFEQGCFDGKFADIAMRMGDLQLQFGDPVIKDLLRLRAYRFYLQAEFALTLRMQAGRNTYDKGNMENLRFKLDSIAEYLPHKKKTHTDTMPTPLLEFVSSHAYCLYELQMKELKNNKVKISVRRMSRSDDNDLGMTLLCYPYFDCCDLTDEVILTAKDTYDTALIPDGTVIFDSVNTGNINAAGVEQIIFSLNGKTVAVISADSYIISRPRL